MPPARLTLLTVSMLVGAFSARAQTPTALPVSLAQLAFDALPTLRQRITLRDWRRLHPADSVFVPPTRDDGGRTELTIGDRDELWCAVAGDFSAIDSHSPVRRRAYFYAPARVAGAPLPRLGSRSANNCVLGAIDLSGPLMSAPRFGADSALLTATWGVGKRNVHSPIPWYFDGEKRGTLMWRVPGGTVQLVDHAPDSLGRFAVQLAITGPALPAGHYVTYFAPDPTPAEVARQRHAPVLDTILRWTGLNSVTRSSIVRYADRFASRSPLGPAEPARLATLLAVVVRPDRSRSTEERVARLMVANHVLQAGANQIGFYEDADSAKRALFTAIGATINMDALEKEFFVWPTWLQQAIELDSRGLVGDRAFLMGAQLGFDFTVGCMSEKEQFREVITRGEKYLATHPHSPNRGEVELLVGTAYGDIIALSNGAAYGDMMEVDQGALPDALEMTTYRADSVGARAAAVRHFREGFRLARSNAAKNNAWTDAWLLSAGMLPLQAHFYCIND